MKKRALLILLVLVMALSVFSVIAMAKDAEAEALNTTTTHCTVETKNIASEGRMYTPQTCWVIADHVGKLVDGDHSTGAGASHSEPGTNRFLDFGTPRNITLVRIYVNYDGNTNVSNDSALSKIKNQDKTFTFVAHPRAESGSNRLCQINFNTKDKTYVDFTSEDWKNQPFQTVEVWNSGYDNTHIIYEIEVYEQTGSHAWKLESTTTPPTCTEKGEGIYKCECGETKTDEIEAMGHNPNEAQWLIDSTKGTHYNTCLNGCGMRTNEEEHDFDNACDSSCDICGVTRVVEGHKYASDCDVTCENCNTQRTAPQPHSYSAECVAKCSNCEYERKNQKAHSFDNDCDDKCDVCGLTRTVSGHSYDAVCDNSCSICGFIRSDAVPHDYKKPCSTECSVCRLAKEDPAPHTYSNNCDATCNECGFEREPSDHAYDNRCDAICNSCSYKRKDALEDHLFANNCDATCNECGFERTPSKHIYGGWEQRLAPTTERPGQQFQKCTSCGVENIEEIPKLVIEEGLSNSAVIAIIASSSAVVIVGCVSIGVYSMIIKPKIAKRKLEEALEAQRKADAENDDEDYDDEDEEHEDDDSQD
ncbi:MAG: hypothetical protein IJF11_04920 [Clostridia bacterium]|nr:hypothetical protein [Clostridia bacterium]